MKYIIEIEDEPFGRNDDPNIPHGMDVLYKAKGFNSLVFDQFGLDKLTPLDKELKEAYLQGKHDAEQDLARAAYDEAYQKGIYDGSLDVKERVEGAYQKGFEAGSHEATTLEYQQGLDDAWGTIIKIALIPYAERSEIFDGLQDILSIMQKFSPSEVITKIKAYEESQKADEIKVGDEVEAFCGRAIVFGTFTDTKGEKFCRYWYPSDDSFNKDKTENLKKTGRNYPQVAELLKAMKGE